MVDWAKGGLFSPMAQSISLPRTSQASPPGLLAILVAGLLFGTLIDVLVAQVAGDRGIAPVAASSDIEVSGIEVDIRAKTADAAREEGWRLAQRKAWEKINGPKLADSQIEELVSAIVIERERIAPGRYIATLGVVFDRTRASSYLGGDGNEVQAASAPLLLVPVTFSAGTQTVYEMRNPWQRAWAEFQPGRSPINYVRPTGSGGDSLLLTYGQIGRRSRTWWRAVLDQFGAADVLVPVARLEYRWPGGPVEGTFTARYGPDNRYLDSFAMTAETPDALPAMLTDAVKRFDLIFRQALADGKLRPDPTLDMASGDLDPAIARLVEIGRAMQERDLAMEVGATPPALPGGPLSEAPLVLTRHVVQFATPDAATFDNALVQVRSTPGVRSAAISSTAIGGTSVMQVTYAGSLEQLAAALRARGYTVVQGNNALSISR